MLTDIESFIVGEVRQTEKDKYYRISLIHGTQKQNEQTR